MTENNVDIESKQIYDGLSDLESIVKGDLEKRILEIDIDLEAGKNYELMLRLKRSLLQFIERKKDLLYVGFLGHFSSGKSSTINSILEINGSKNARKIDLHPTDKSITLITHPKNEHSFIRMVSYGYIPVEIKFIENKLLEGIVLIDTPGSGDTDPLLVNELMQDFLPICDLILYVFSATSLLDENDLPLLRAKQSQLSLIPIKYIITRADEFLKNHSDNFSINNYDKLATDMFVSHAIARIKLPIKELEIDNDDFFIIDNRVGFQINVVIDYLNELVKNMDLISKIKMHQYKINLYRKNAHTIKMKFLDIAEIKSKTLATFIKDAAENITRYHDKVRISNNRLTENWREYGDEIFKIVQKNLKDLNEQNEGMSIPEIFYNHEILVKWEMEFKESYRFHIPSKAENIYSKFLMTAASQLTNAFLLVENEISKINFDSFNKFDFVNLEINVKVGTIDLSSDFFILNYDIKKLKTNLVKWIREFSSLMISNSNSLVYRLGNILPLPQFQKIIEKAISGIYDDIDIHFENVYLYRTGVFSEHVKEYISRLGIGYEMDRLEKEFDDSFKDDIKKKTAEILFPEINLAYDNFRNSLIQLEQKAKINSQSMKSLNISKLDEINFDYNLIIEDEKPKLINQLETIFNQRVRNFIRDLSNTMSVNIRNKRNDYRISKKGISKKRRKRFFLFIGLAFMVVLPFSIFTYYDLSATNASSTFLISLLANIVLPVLSFIIAKLTDSYSTEIKKKKDEYNDELIKECLSILNEKKQALDKDETELQLVSVFLAETITKQVDIIKKNDFLVYAENLYHDIRLIVMNDSQLRAEYIQHINSISNDFQNYFRFDNKKLELISKEIKQEAIDPSFRFLEELKNNISGVIDNLNKAKFII